MYKKIYEKIKLILVAPKKFWEEESTSDKKYDVPSQFVYPLLGLVALSAFIGYWWNYGAFDLPKALQITCVSFASGFAGFFVASFLVDELSHSILKMEKNTVRTRNFVGYSSIVFYLIYIFLYIFPSFFFVFLFLFYTVYIVWEGSDVYMHVREKDRQKFTIGASVIIVASPLLIEKILSAFLPGI